MKKEEILRIVDEAVDSKIKSFNFYRQICVKVREIVKEEMECNNDKVKEKDYNSMVIFVRTIKNIFYNMFITCDITGELHQLYFESRDGRSKFCIGITKEEFNNLIPFVEVRF